MSSAPAPSPPRAGLRERKKARTRAEIRTQGLRLFAEQGYHKTTTEQMVYVGDDGLIGRHDYDLEIAGNSRGAHCISRYTQAAAS